MMIFSLALKNLGDNMSFGDLGGNFGSNNPNVTAPDGGQFANITNLSNQGNTPRKVALGGGALTSIIGFATLNPGLIIGGAVQLLGGVLSSMFRPKRDKSAQEVFFDRQTKFYTELGRKTNMANGILRMYGSSNQLDTSPSALIKKYPYKSEGEFGGSNV